MKKPKKKWSGTDLKVFRATYSLYGNAISKVLHDIESGILVLPQGKSIFYNDAVVRRLGNTQRKGQLQKDLDSRFDNILRRLRMEFPGFTKRQLRLFSYIAADLPDYLIYKLLHLPSEDMVYQMKKKMLAKIMYTACKYRDEYIAMLDN